MTPPEVLAIGVSPATAVGAAVLARPEAMVLAADELTARLSTGESSVAVVVGRGRADPVATAREAIQTGRPVLLEPIGQCSATELASLASAAEDAQVPAIAAFRRRHEPALPIISRSVAGGSIGLPFAVQAEVLASRAPDAATELLDMLDALCDAIVLEPRAAHRTAKTRARLEGPDILSARLANEASALIGVRLRRSAGAEDDADAPGEEREELATVRLMGSHGTVTADLEAPALEIRSDGDGEDRRARVHGSSADLLVDGFMTLLAGGGTGRLATLGRAAALAATPGWDRGGAKARR